MKIKPVSKPFPYNSKKGLAKWVVYYYNPDKAKRWAKYFITKDEANVFYEETKILKTKLGIEANRIDFEDKRDIIEAKRLLEPHNISPINAIRAFVRFSEDLKSYGVSLEEAIESFKSTNKVKEHSIALEVAIGRYEASLYQKDITALYRKKVTQNLERFMLDIGEKKILSNISAKEIETWILNLKKRIYTDSPDIILCAKPMKVFVDSNEAVCIRTRNEFRGTLYTFFKYCKMQDLIEKNPVEKIPAWKERKKTPKIFTPEEIKKILDMTDSISGLRAYVAISAFTGIRCAELQRLTWDKIKLEDREIVLDNEITKTASRRIVKIPENLAKWLEPYVWELGTKKKVVGEHFKGKFARLQKEFTNGWIRNGLRHSAATYYLALTQNAYITAEQMGHSVEVLKQHYNGLAREKDAIRYFEILPDEKATKP